MPSRVIRGEINASRSLARVSILADLTFRALVVAVDDYGRFEADPLMLKAALYPRRADVMPETVRGWVDELAAEGCVDIYVVDGAEYLQLTGWEEHRGAGRRASRSKYPDPKDSDESPEILGNARNAPEIPCSYRGTGSENREAGSDDGADAPSPPVLAIADPPESKPPRRSRRVAETPPPDRLTDAERAAIAAWCRSRFRSLTSRTVALEEACLDWARGKGVTRSDWSATVRTWIRKTAEDPKAMAAATATTGVPRAPIPDVREPGVDYEAERREILRLIEEKKRA
jgi:hypothetical protein